MPARQEFGKKLEISVLGRLIFIPKPSACGPVEAIRSLTETPRPRASDTISEALGNQVVWCLRMSADTDSQPQERTFQIRDLVLTAPLDWDQGEQGPAHSEDEVQGVIASPEGQDQAVVLVTITPTKGRSLATLEIMIRNYVEMNGVLEFERHTTIGGYPALEVVYRLGSGFSEQGDRKILRVVIEKDGYFYTIQGAAGAGTFAAHAGVLEKIATSVHWTQ
jgi:hypothetical protein